MTRERHQAVPCVSASRSTCAVCSYPVRSGSQPASPRSCATPCQRRRTLEHQTAIRSPRRPPCLPWSATRCHRHPTQGHHPPIQCRHPRRRRAASLRRRPVRPTLLRARRRTHPRQPRPANGLLSYATPCRLRLRLPRSEPSTTHERSTSTNAFCCPCVVAIVVTLNTRSPAQGPARSPSRRRAGENIRGLEYVRTESARWGPLRWRRVFSFSAPANVLSGSLD